MKFGDEVNLNSCQLKKWPFVEILPEQKKPAHNAATPQSFVVQWYCTYSTRN